MDFNTLIDNALTVASAHINRKPRNKLAELNTRGVLHSSSAVTETFSILTEEIKNVLLDLLDNLAKTNLSFQQIKILRSKIEDFILREYQNHEQHLIKMRIYREEYKLGDYIQVQMNDALSAIEIKLRIIDQAAKNRMYKAIWEIARIVVTAVIGGFIGAYIKGWIAP
ncbi:hypothetical protein [Paenibacillus terrae]|uniref:Uncharacterized protein n=1 Tax=Paenibacillus terrae TaxID=159743 RepID=A0A0D7X4U2_9BACL|nr:hypothetical protein [Paenibacillus terrae]KJD45993.1 hypothetical protein QD47_08395 [Paenibacillus terrae]